MLWRLAVQPEFEYLIAHDGENPVSIPIFVDKTSRCLVVIDEDNTPGWAKLDFHKCPHCTLSSNQEYCPVARNVSHYLGKLRLGNSYEPVTITVKVASRMYVADTTAQRALGSLFGLISSLSPCPHTLPFRTMSLFHLPLANESETIVRAASLFLLKSFLDVKKGIADEVSLDAMIDAYRNLKLLNRYLVKRFQNSALHDSHVNALIILDVLARDIDTGLEDPLVTLEPFFYFGM